MMQALYNRLRLETGMTLAAGAIEHAVRRRMRETGSAAPHAYALLALGDAQELSALIDQVVVPETWFFRDAEAFSAAAAFAAQRLRSGRRPVRLLSVPCATGEEPYSMAMALAEAGIPPGEVIIDAMDVSRGAIERARRGIYHRNAFRTRDLAFRDRHFQRLEGNGDGHRGHVAYELRKEIRTVVRFRCANLLALEQDAAAEQYDIIFCRNLLIYFDEATQRNAAARLRCLLRDDGLLLSGYAETNALIQHGFAAAPFPKAFALTKAAPAAETAASPPAAAAPLRNARKRPSAPPARPPSPPVRQALPAAAPAQPHAGLEASLRHAREMADAGNRREAERLYEQCLRLAPDCAEAYFMLGLLLEQQRNMAAAAEHLRRAVYLDPDHYEALCHLALLAEQDGDAAAARQLKSRAERVFQRQTGMRGKP